MTLKELLDENLKDEQSIWVSNTGIVPDHLIDMKTIRQCVMHNNGNLDKWNGVEYDIIGTRK